MAATEIVKKVYRPLAGSVAKFYAAPYGSTVLMPFGNVLEASTEMTESVEKQDNMTELGGGTHAVLRRVTGIMLKLKVADVNTVNVARAQRATVVPQDAGTVVDAPYIATLGSLIALPHINVTDFVIKKGETVGAATPVDAAPNFVARPGGGIWLREDAPGLVNADKLWVSYSHADQVVMETVTAATPELYIYCVGLNEVDTGGGAGKPYVLNMWRVSQSVTKQLALVTKGFVTLDIEGELMEDPTKDGVGESKYMQRIEG